MIFKKGDKVKVRYGGDLMTAARGKQAYKRGVFSHYTGFKYGYFVHASGKLLRRLAEEIELDDAKKD